MISRIKNKEINQRFQLSYKVRSTIILIICVSIFLPSLSLGQTRTNDSIPATVNLPDAVAYAIRNQPLIQQSELDEEITASNIRSRLADWYPQVNFAFGLQHNFVLPTNFIGGNAIRAGVNNTSSAQFSVSQAIFNRDVLLARRTRGDVLLLSRQSTSNNKIELAVSVTKAFYDVLTTTQQIRVADENIIRTERSLKDATAQYTAGIADKIDYKRATISLNNLRASRKINEELARAKIEYLKALMNYPEDRRLEVIYDSTAMEAEVNFDTLITPDYRARVEYRILETQQKLSAANLDYNRWSYLPTVSANGAYNFNFQNNQFGKLYEANYPNSFAGITIGVPIFQGGRRKANTKTAELQLSRVNLDIVNFQNTVNSQYALALAGYKSSLINYLALKQNILLAKEVYDVIQLQYRSGIKTYLEVITAEADLRTAQINYFNALYQVLVNKVDVQRALGQIVY